MKEVGRSFPKETFRKKGLIIPAAAILMVLLASCNAEHNAVVIGKEEIPARTYDISDTMVMTVPKVNYLKVKDNITEGGKITTKIILMKVADENAFKSIKVGQRINIE